MNDIDQKSGRRPTVVGALKLTFGWLGIAVDAGCIVLAMYLVRVALQRNPGDAVSSLIVAAPILIVIMVLATTIAIECLGTASRR